MSTLAFAKVYKMHNRENMIQFVKGTRLKRACYGNNQSMLKAAITSTTKGKSEKLQRR